MSTIVDVPGMGEVEFPDGMSDDDISAAIRKNMQPQQSSMERLGLTPKQLGRNVALGARGLLDAAIGIPGMAADAVWSAGNMLTGSKSPLPTEVLNQRLDRFMPTVQNVGDFALRAVPSVLAGAKLPMPGVKEMPSLAPDSVKMRTLAESQKAGYVVPPSTTNPSTANRLLESIGGKIGTEQDAALKNTGVTTRLARRALGLADDVDITPEALSGLRKQAARPYGEIRGAGKITATPSFQSALDDIVAPFKSASKDFPELANSEVTAIADAVRKESFDAASGIDAIALIREKAAKAYTSGSKQEGGAYKNMAGALEDLIEENLVSRGKDGADMLKNFREARKLIAKTYSVEKALNPATGNVSAQKLAAQLNKGKPLEGDLLTAARFGQGFPKVAREMLDSGSVRNTDVILGGGAAVIQKEPSLLLYPFVRQAVRAGLLSPQGQRLARPSAFALPQGVLPVGAALNQQPFGLFQQ